MTGAVPGDGPGGPGRDATGPRPVPVADAGSPPGGPSTTPTPTAGATTDGASGPATADGLSVRGLVAGYGSVPVVHGIDLSVRAGEVVALLGANGAGKTTTLLALSGLARTFAGEVLVGGEIVVGGGDPDRRRGPGGARAGARRVARSGVAHVPEDRALFPTLSARRTLRLAVPRRRAAAAVDEAVGWFPALGPVLDRPAGLLSGGEQQMLALARALVASPRVLLVDEMSLGLAPLVVEALLPVVRAAATEHGTAVVVVEQHVPAALAIADRVVVLRGGRVALRADATVLRADRQLLEASYLGDG